MAWCINALGEGVEEDDGTTLASSIEPGFCAKSTFLLLLVLRLTVGFRLSCGLWYPFRV